MFPSRRDVIVIHEVRGDAWGYQGSMREYRFINGKPLPKRVGLPPVPC